VCQQAEETTQEGAPMATITMTGTDFEQTVTDNQIVLVDFWAAWCGPCRMFGPLFEQASEAHPDIVFGKVDTEAEPELASIAQISSIPTLMAFKDGHLVFRQAGALPAQGLAQLIDAVQQLDTTTLTEEEQA
jgi:thioredoxin